VGAVLVVLAFTSLSLAALLLMIWRRKRATKDNNA
jgi:hypothetical protein